MKKRKVLATILGSCMVLSLAACGGDTTTTSTPPAPTGSAVVEGIESQVPAGGTVGVCIYKFDDNFMTTYRTALETILKEKGYEVTVVDGNNDQAKQTEQINTFIAQGVDALIINPVMTSAASSIVNLVQTADIPTVFINREPTAEDMGSYNKCVYVGCDAAQSGTFQGELILETETKGDINGDGKVSYIMIQGDPENIDAKLRTEYSVKALTDAGMEVEQLNLTRGDWDQNKGQEICANDLAQFGDKVEVVFSNNDSMALGAMEAIKTAGRTVGKDIYIVGVDALDAALDAVKAGEMTGTVLNDAQSQAEKAVECMAGLLGGTTYTEGEQSIYVDYVKVTSGNVNEFIK